MPCLLLLATRVPLEGQEVVVLHLYCVFVRDVSKGRPCCMSSDRLLCGSRQCPAHTSMAKIWQIS